MWTRSGRAGLSSWWLVADIELAGLRCICPGQQGFHASRRGVPEPGQHKEGSANNQLSTREHVCLDVPSVPEPPSARSARKRTKPSSRRTVESEGRGPAYDRRRVLSVAPRAASVKHQRATTCADRRCSPCRCRVPGSFRVAQPTSPVDTNSNVQKTTRLPLSRSWSLSN